MESFYATMSYSRSTFLPFLELLQTLKQHFHFHHRSVIDRERWNILCTFPSFHTTKMKSNYSCLPLVLRGHLLLLAILGLQITKASCMNIFDGTGFNSQYDIQPCTEQNKGDCNCGTGTIQVCNGLINVNQNVCMTNA